jgi:hypothetical protein
MKSLLFASALLLGAVPAFAQSGTNVPPGQSPAKTLNQAYFLAGTDPAGFGENSQAQSAGTGTNQNTAAVLPARANIVSCASGAGVMLPPVSRYTPISIMNRGAAACLIYPTLGAQLETAPGTLAAANAAFSLTAGADVTFRPAVIGGVTEWLQ